MAKVQEKKSKVKTILATVGVILAVIIVAGTLLANYIVTDGWVQRFTVSMTSDNYKVNNAMMTYFFNASYQSFLNNYGDQLGSMLDTTKSLRDQEYYSGTSWYDYLMSSTETQVQSLIVLCEAAKEAGVKLTSTEKKQVTDTIDALATQATNNQVSLSYYIKSAYGTCVTKRDIKKCLEMQQLASKYQAQLTESYEYGTADYDTYYNENVDSYQFVDYLTYTVEAQTLEDGVTKDTASAKTVSDKLAAATTADDFTAIVRDYLTTVVYADEIAAEAAEASEAATTAETATTETADTKINTAITGMTKTKVTKSSSDLLTWAFGDEAKVGATFVENNEEAGTYTVSLLTKESYREDQTTLTIRHMMLTTSTYGEDEVEAKANEVYGLFTANVTADNFASLAAEYSDDTRENAQYKNIDTATGIGVDEVDAWLAEDGRKVGDYTLVKSESYGWHIVYVEAEGLPAWQANIDTTLRNDKYNEDLTAFGEKYPITTNAENIIKVIPVKLSSNSSSSSSSAISAA